MTKLKEIILQLYEVYCREFKLVANDAGMIIFFAFLPLGYPIIYSLIYNPELVRDVPFVVVDHDRTPLSRELVRELDATQDAALAGYAANIDEARHAMDNRDCFGILEIPEGFERNIGRNESAEAVMFCDMSLMLRYRSLLVAATNVSQNMGSQITSRRIDTLAPLASTIDVGDPLSVNNISLGNIESGFDSFIMPGVVILILHQCIILACGMAGGAKHEDRRLFGYNTRNSVPSTAISMLGQMLCYITIMILPAIFLVHYVPLIFSFPMAGTKLDVFLFLVPLVLASMALGFLLQVAVRERENIFIIWVATSIVFLFLSGLTWPRYAMPEFWKALSAAIPATWGVEGFIRINTNGATLAQVHECYLNLWLLTAIYMTLAYFAQRHIRLFKPKLLRE
ncbi:MAG: ABC transporter permease [Clostridium sp.]|nr:ABC transporter permease [Prevotella sp.]MCM1428562.1 ABC transporter permease [Clostridium sp.]MCM1475027.1 ABC transporter permease [Muribaculaceae bacterium]